MFNFNSDYFHSTNMDSLIITDHDNEYYLNDQKLYFLENTKQVNLFIGANNTRKSRFLRKIIEAESRIIVSSEKDINKMFIVGKNLVSEIENQFKDLLNAELMVVVSTRHPPQAGKRFYEIDTYFNGTRASNDKGVNIKTIVDSLNNINQTLMGIRGGDNIGPLLKEIKMVYDIVDMLVYLYGLRGNMAALSNYQSNSNTWPEDNLNAYAFTFADGRIDGDTTEKEDMLKRVKAYFEFLLTVSVTVGSNYLIYIPVLRSARTLIMPTGSPLYENVFKHTVHQQHFNGKLSNNGDQIHTGLDFYEEIKKQKGGSSIYRTNFKEFEKFIGRSFFQSEDLEIIASHSTAGSKQAVVVDLPGERKDIAIQDLGDGVHAVINLLFPIFSARDESWIFIDEPELNLHPGFQNLFIRTLLENEFLKAKNLRYFINSHSNHILSELLLAGSENAEIFVFSKRDKDSSAIKPFSGYEAATLELLGVLNTSTLLSNCSVWVEGITDRLYLRAYLTAYLKSGQKFNPIEGLNYTFIEYGGNNLVHYLFEDNNDPAAIDAGIKGSAPGRSNFKRFDHLGETRAHFQEVLSRKIC